MTPEGTWFAATQVTVPWPLGPPDGRHVVRAGRTGDDGDGDGDGAIVQVVVLETVGAPERTRLGRLRGVGDAGDAATGMVAVGRATVIATARPLGDRAAAHAWLATAGEPELADGLAVLGRVLQAHRIAVADPHLPPVTRDALIAARVGCGTGAGLAEGSLESARELSAWGRTDERGTAVRRRRRALVPVARLADLLSGRDEALACEELVLRARADLDGGRPREAALQLLVALDAALAELPADPHAATLGERLADLRGRREAVAAAAQAALSGPPSAAEQATVAETVARLAAALRARAAAGSRAR